MSGSEAQSSGPRMFQGRQGLGHRRGYLVRHALFPPVLPTFYRGTNMNFARLKIRRSDVVKLSRAKCVRLGRTLLPAFAAALLLSFPGLAAQSQNNQKESLGEAARKARQQKKPASKPVKVVTEDDLARRAAAAPGQPAPAAETPAQGVAPAAEPGGQPAQEESARPEASSAPSTETKGEPEQRLAGLEADFKAAKQQLAEAERELNLLQREFDLRRDQYYSNPDFKSDKQGKVLLDSLQQQVSVRQQEVERLKEKVASLEAERKTLPAAPASQEKPAAPPQP